MSEVIKLKFKGNNKFKANFDSFTAADGEIKEKINYENELKKQSEAAYKQGYDDGFNQAKFDIESQYADEMLDKSEEFIKILSSLEEKISAYEASFGDIVAKVAVKIAEKILYTQLPNKETFERIIKEASQKIVGADEIVIRLNPTDYANLKLDELERSLGGGFGKISFDVTNKVNVGGCFIDTEIGSIDARIETQLEEVLNAIHKMNGEQK